jgi:uncharacterized membrane protein YadS
VNTLKIIQGILSIFIFGTLAFFLFRCMYELFPELSMIIFGISAAGIGYEVYRKYGGSGSGSGE